MTELHDSTGQRCHALLRDPLWTRVEPSRGDRCNAPKLKVQMSASANEAVVRLAIDAIWNQGDLDIADQLFSPEYVNLDSQIGDLILGPESVKLSAALYRLAFPNLHVTVNSLTANVDTVVVHWTASRGPPGPDGVLAADRELLTGTTLSRLDGGRIVETRTNWTST
jgi:hypothetical protein